MTNTVLIGSAHYTPLHSFVQCIAMDSSQPLPVNSCYYIRLLKKKYQNSKLQIIIVKVSKYKIAKHAIKLKIHK